MKGEGGVEREKYGVGDGSEGVYGSTDYVCKIFVKGEGEEEEAKDILKKGDNVSVDEKNAGGDGEMLRDDDVGSSFCFRHGMRPVIRECSLVDYGDAKIGG